MLILAAAACVATPALAAPPAANEAARLRAIAEAVDEAWNAGDADRIADLYAAEGDLWPPGAAGPVDGREAVRQHFKRAFAARRDAVRHVSEVRRLDKLTPDIVLADVSVRLEERQADGSWKVTRRFSNATLVVRQGQAWKLRSVRAFVTG
ncbi:MAG TPA: nuclear transport factor 2 family protein [Caulobacteraceae bacterium]|nr:nuclear transport factor 2 family protein [Caulobacteraceae bacterium]